MTGIALNVKYTKYKMCEKCVYLDLPLSTIFEGPDEKASFGRESKQKKVGSMLGRISNSCQNLL